MFIIFDDDDAFNEWLYVCWIIFFRAKDIVKISLIPSHNAANVNNGTAIQNNAGQIAIDEQQFNKINIANKETTTSMTTKPMNKYVLKKVFYN